MTNLIFRGALLAFLLTGCNRVHLGTHDGGGGGHDAGVGEHDAGPAEQCGPTVCGPGTVCCNPSCGICAPPESACPAIGCAEVCTSNADCASAYYCARSVGTCGGEGTCVPRPTDCPPVIREVCGCDGVTYASPCDANVNGVSLWNADRPCGPPTPCAAQHIEGQGACAAIVGVRWNGAECESVSGCGCAGADCDAIFASLSECQAAYAACTPGCTSNTDCVDGSYCHFEGGACGGAGECRPIPGELPCAPGAQPVCGCDGLDYSCEAVANQSGVSAAHLGACEAGCEPMDATGVGACFLSLGYRWTGTTCEFIGGCECEGADCGRLADTEAECQAAHAGCAGTACGGRAGSTCGPSEWCDFAEPHYCGGADEMGVCRPRPSGCETVFAPACGCDRVVYDNACAAQASGVDTLADPDACDAPPPSP